MIRSMRTSDIPDVQQAAQSSWHATYDGIIPIEVQNRFLNAAYSEEMMIRRLERSVMFVAEVGGSIVGFANFSQVREGGIVELSAIYLLPGHQGRGLGTALLRAGIDNSDGVQEIYANVEKGNKIGCGFYASKGFKIVEEFDDELEGHRLRTIRMVLNL